MLGSISDGASTPVQSRNRSGSFSTPTFSTPNYSDGLTPLRQPISQSDIQGVNIRTKFDMEALQSQNKQLSTDLAKLKRGFETLITENSNITTLYEGGIQSLESELTSSKSEVARYRSKLTENHDKAAAIITGLKQEIRAQRDQNRLLTESLETARSERPTSDGMDPLEKAKLLTEIRELKSGNVIRRFASTVSRKTDKAEIDRLKTELKKEQNEKAAALQLAGNRHDITTDHLTDVLTHISQLVPAESRSKLVELLTSLNVHVHGLQTFSLTESASDVDLLLSGLQSITTADSLRQRFGNLDSTSGRGASSVASSRLNEGGDGSETLRRDDSSELDGGRGASSVVSTQSLEVGERTSTIPVGGASNLPVNSSLPHSQNPFGKTGVGSKSGFGRK